MAASTPSRPPGRVFTMALALGGIFTVAVAATELLSTIITGELRDFLGKRRMRKRIDALEQHVIVCGYGHVGQHVCADLLGRGVPFVVDRSLRRPPLSRRPRDARAHAVLGDATEDATLRRAGIERARALIAVAGTDADNVLITMTARLLCPTLPIVARAEEDGTVPKLLIARALRRTVSPHAIAGGRMAQAVLRPAVLDFIEVATSKEHTDLQMEEQLVPPGSPLDGKTVGTSGLRSPAGADPRRHQAPGRAPGLQPRGRRPRRGGRHPHHARQSRATRSCRWAGALAVISSPANCCGAGLPCRSRG